MAGVWGQVTSGEVTFGNVLIKHPTWTGIPLQSCWGRDDQSTYVRTQRTGHLTPVFSQQNPLVAGFEWTGRSRRFLLHLASISGWPHRSFGLFLVAFDIRKRASPEDIFGCQKRIITDRHAMSCRYAACGARGIAERA